MVTTETAASLSLDDLLRVPADEPERIFAPEQLHRQYGAWLKVWWPQVDRVDRHAEAAFMHFQALYACALERSQAGSWQFPGVRSVVDVQGVRHDIEFLVRRPFELGEVFVGNQSVAFFLDPTYRDLYDRARSLLGRLPFADVSMRAMFTDALPAVTAAFEIALPAPFAGKLVLVVRKPAEYLLLADVLTHGELDPRHAAWIVSGLHNLACWLQFAGIAHGAIAVDTIFVSPVGHSVSLLGGWWYATRYGAPIAALRAATVAALPAEVLEKHRGDSRIDPTLVRELAQNLLSGTGANARVRVQNTLAMWLRLTSGGDARADYAIWERVRTEVFGPRKFITLDLTAADLYRPIVPLHS